MLASARVIIARTLAVLALVTATHADPAAPFEPRQRRSRVVGRTDASVTLSNVRWGFVANDSLQPRFQVTTVRLDAVRAVYYYSQRFDPKWLMSHGTLVFLMNDLDGVKGASGQRDVGLVFSMEARYRVGETFDLRKGLARRYPAHYQLTTVGDRLQWAFPMYRETLERFRLDLAPRQRRLLLERVIREAVEDRTREFYHLITNNCGGNAVRVLNDMLPPGRQIPIWRIPGVWYNTALLLPNQTPLELVRRGIATAEPTWSPDQRFADFPLADGSFHRVALPRQLVPPPEPGSPSPDDDEAIHAGVLEVFDADLERMAAAYVETELPAEPALARLNRDLLRKLLDRARAGALSDPELVDRLRRLVASPRGR